MTGLNSLLLGSQVASQIIVNGMIIFAPFYKNSKIKLIKNRNILFLTCLIFYPFVATQTLNLILLIIILIFFFILPNSTLNNKFSKYSIPFMILFSILLLPLFFFRVSRLSDLVIYVKAWMPPVLAFSDLDIYSKLFGVGDFNSSIMLESTDFGFGVLLLNMGLIPIIFLIIILSKLFISNYYLIKKSVIKKFDDNPWVYIASVNLLCTISWLLSLFHYTQVLEMGGRHILAFHLAVAFLSVKKLKEIEKCID